MFDDSLRQQVDHSVRIAVVGGGPAGLRAAEVCAHAGAQVQLFDAKRSVGRKFLVAGRGGLNLTKDESPERFATRYSSGPDEPPGFWRDALATFGPTAMQTWAAGLGIKCFTASSGRIYPREMKAAPLLRRWVERLRRSGVEFSMQHTWSGLDPGPPLQLRFSTPTESVERTADAVILALGGGSWPETGSDGRWVETFAAGGIEVAPLAPANCGWECEWSADFIAQADGQPLKNIIARTSGAEAVGELMITCYGLEGGALYQLGPALRRQREPEVVIDLKPDVTIGQLIRKMGTFGRNPLGEARTRWRLSAAAHALLAMQPAETRASALDLATAARNCRVRLIKPRPLAEAISSSGGIRWSELDSHLQFRRWPGVFAAGEMIDWEAPTGGYLIQGCFATATIAASGALAFVAGSSR